MLKKLLPRKHSLNSQKNNASKNEESPSTPKSPRTPKSPTSPKGTNFFSSHSPAISEFIDLTEYEFNFEVFLDLPDCRQSFFQYLTSVHNREPLEFLSTVEEYESKRTHKVRHELGGNIITTYIKPFCRKEINIGDKERKELINYFTNKCNAENCPTNLFAQLYTTVLTELKVYCFPKFLTSDQFKDFLLEKIQNSNDNGQEFLRFVAKKKSASPRNTELTTAGEVKQQQ